MDKYFSQKDLDKVYRKEIKEKGKAAFERSLENKSLHHGKKNSARHIFLCHAHVDKMIVDKIYAFFKTLNVELYIDWMDHSLPEFTNALTASSVKKKIDESSKFIFLATARALTSRWCNWELGLAYSRKDMQLAIFPIETWTGKWAGNEYLHLYPVIERSGSIETLTIDDLKVHTPDKQIIEFRNWLGSS
ncbi:toll/interleukin-1 receptor domain-containing protein [Mucilaginibacter phyllosphaerae]